MEINFDEILRKTTKSSLARPLELKIKHHDPEESDRIRRSIEVDKWQSANNYDMFRNVSQALFHFNENKFNNQALKFFISKHTKMDLDSERILYDLKNFNVYNNNSYDAFIDNYRGNDYLNVKSFAYKYGIVLLEQLKDTNGIYFDSLLTLDVQSTIDLYRIFKTKTVDLTFADNNAEYYTKIIESKRKVENIDILDTLKRLHKKVDFEVIEKNQWVQNTILSKKPEYYASEIKKIEDKKQAIEKGVIIGKNSPKRVIGVLSGWMLGLGILSSFIGVSVYNHMNWVSEQRDYVEKSRYSFSFAEIYKLNLGIENDYFTYKQLIDKSREKFSTSLISSNFIPNYNEYITNVSLLEESTLISGDGEMMKLNFPIKLESINPYNESINTNSNLLALNISAKDIFQDTSSVKYWKLDKNVWKLRKDMLVGNYLDHVTDFRNKYKIYLGFKSTTGFDWKLLSLKNTAQKFGNFELAWDKTDDNLKLSSQYGNRVKQTLINIELI